MATGDRYYCKNVPKSNGKICLLHFLSLYDSFIGIHITNKKDLDRKETAKSF
jgi:hypothetical protein